MVQRIPARRETLKIFHNWLNYHLFSATSVAAVHIGIHGWLYPKQTSQVLAPAVARQQGNRLFLELHTVEKMINATGRRFLVTVVPGKAAIYPEYVGSGMKGVQSPLHKALVEAKRPPPPERLYRTGTSPEKSQTGWVGCLSQTAPAYGPAAPPLPPPNRS
jgi:hypothetical protein